MEGDEWRALPDRLIKITEVMDIVGFSRTMIYKLIREGRFPAQYKPGGASSRWSAADIAEWVQAVKDARDKPRQP